MPPLAVNVSLAAEPGTPEGDEVRARLSRRDPADWPWLLGELRIVAAALAPSYRDVSSTEDVLGELALLAHERWLADWASRPEKVSARLFLRDRLRDHLREMRRRQERRGILLSGAVASAAMVETDAGARSALFADPPPRPDESLELEQLRRAATTGVPAGAEVLGLREAGFEQQEIAARTGLSRPTVSRRLAAVAALVAAIGVGLVGLAVRLREQPVVILPEPAGVPSAPTSTGAGSTTPHAALPSPATAPVAPPEPAPQGPTSLPSIDDEARLCLTNGDNVCVIRLLANGRAQTANQLAMLAAAQRMLTGTPSTCPTLTELLERFPASQEAQRYRPLHVAQCQGR